MVMKYFVMRINTPHHKKPQMIMNHTQNTHLI